jgi:hypothetical protein
MAVALAVFSLSAHAAPGVIDIEPYKTEQVFVDSEAPDAVTIENISVVEQETRVTLAPYGCAIDSEHDGICYRRVVLAHVPVVRVLVTYSRSSGSSSEANPWVDEFRLPLETWKASGKVSFSRALYRGAVQRDRPYLRW